MPAKNPHKNEILALRARGWTLKRIGEYYDLSKQRIGQITGTTNRQRPGLKTTCQNCGQTTKLKTTKGQLTYITICKNCQLGKCPSCGQPKSIDSNKCRVCHNKLVANPNEYLICHLYAQGYGLQVIADAGLGVITTVGVLYHLRRHNISRRTQGPHPQPSKPITQAIQEYKAECLKQN